MDTTPHILHLSNGGRLQYQTTTPTAPSSGPKPTLLFVHYWGGSIRTFRKVIASLTAYSTIAVNLPGWSGSTLPDQEDSSGTKLTIDSQARAILEILLLLPPELKLNENGVVLVGHSMGAKICLALVSLLASSQGHAKSTMLKGMVLIAPAPPSPLILPPEMQEQQRHAYDSAASVEFTVTNILSSRDRLTEEDIAFAIEDGLSGLRVAKEAWPAYGMGENVEVPQGDGMDVVVLAGELDVVETKERVRSEVVERLRGKGYKVDFEVVEGRRHLLPLESPGVVVKAIFRHFQAI